MPFISIAKKNDGDQKITPAEPVVTKAGMAGGQQSPVDNTPTQDKNGISVETGVESEEMKAPSESYNNGEIEHEESKKVPTMLPGQEVNITGEGVKEIKGPPLPSDSSEQVDISSVSSDLPVGTQQTLAGEQAGNNPAPSLEALVENSANTAPVEGSVGETLPPLSETLEETVSTSSGNEVKTAGKELQQMEVTSAISGELPEELPAISSEVNTEDLESPAFERIKTISMDSEPNDMEINEETGTPSEEEVLAQSIDPNTATIERYFDLVLLKNASDLHFGVGYPVFMRVDGTLDKVGTAILEGKHIERFISSILTEDQKKTLKETKEVDLSYEYGENARFRINVYHEKGNMAAAFRFLPSKIRTIQELKLPQIANEFIEIPQGFVLVTGPTGSGKSTTIAAMVQEINSKQRKHIISIEDPIEYVYPKGASLVDQREMHKDTLSWDNALRAVLRQDPNVVVVGEMRDFETIAAAITVAETGHLVFATLHTNTAVQTIDRIIDVFPQHQQAQIRSQLSNVISAVISQRLIPVKSGGRRAVTEIMIGTPAVRNAIREGKTYQIDNIIQTSFDVGMVTLERSLVDLIREGEISVEDAQKHTTRPEELVRLMKKA